MSDATQLSWRHRMLYALGQLPEGVKTAAFGFFLLFYYNQVLGLSGTLAGAALFIALLFDAVTDPLVGSWSDFTWAGWVHQARDGRLVSAKSNSPAWWNRTSRRSNTSSISSG